MAKGQIALNRGQRTRNVDIQTLNVMNAKRQGLLVNDEQMESSFGNQATKRLMKPVAAAAALNSC